MECRVSKRANSKYKIDRRLRVNLWGRPKSPLNKREYGPGQHGQGRTKPTDYRLQLMAKQRLKVKSNLNFQRETAERKGENIPFRCWQRCPQQCRKTRGKHSSERLTRTADAASGAQSGGCFQAAGKADGRHGFGQADGRPERQAESGYGTARRYGKGFRAGTAA